MGSLDLERPDTPSLMAQVKMGKTDEFGFIHLIHPDTGKTHGIPTDVVGEYYSSYMEAEKPDDKESIEREFGRIVESVD